MINNDFLKENRVKAYYLNEEYVDGVDDEIDQYIYDDQSPESTTLFFNNKEEFDTTFVNYPEEIDFNNHIVILYIFPDVSLDAYILEKIQLDDMQLTIKLKLTNNKNKDATMPYQRCLMVIMDSVELSSVIFTK